jgi:hypothetical protein
MHRTKVLPGHRFSSRPAGIAFMHGDPSWEAAAHVPQAWYLRAAPWQLVGCWLTALGPGAILFLVLGALDSRDVTVLHMNPEARYSTA